MSVFNDKLKNRNYILFFITFGLFIIASIRYDIGTDYPTYYHFFEKIKPYNFSLNYSTGFEHFEPLFRYTVAILKNFIVSPIFYFSFWALITLVFVWKGIKDQSKNYLLSIFIFFCIFYVNYQFNGIRQGITMGIFLFSIKYIVERKIIPVLIISIVSALFHSSGILILFAYFLSMDKIRNRVVLLSILFTSMFVWKFGLGETFFSIIILLFPTYFQDMVAMYLIKFGDPITLINYLQRLLVIIPLVFFYTKLSDDDKFRKLFPIYFWGCIFYLTFGFLGMLITRINMFFRMLEVILIPILYDRLHGKYQKLFVLTIIMLWGFTVLSWVYFKEAYYPFKTIFGNIL